MPIVVRVDLLYAYTDSDVNLQKDTLRNVFLAFWAHLRLTKLTHKIDSHYMLPKKGMMEFFHCLIFKQYFFTHIEKIIQEK